MNLKGVDPRWLLYGALVIGVVYVGFKVTKLAGQGAKILKDDVLPAVNPADEHNLINRGVSAAGAAVTGDESWTLGGQLAEWFNPATRQVNDLYGKNQKTLTPPPITEPVDPWTWTPPI